MQALSQTKQCYSSYIANCLDDRTAKACGTCANCYGRELLSSKVSMESKRKASEYLNGLTIPIEPRRMWATAESGQKKILYINQPGLCLSKYGDAGYGELVKRGKQSAQRRFCDELVGKSAEVLRPIIRQHHIEAVTCVPSNRSNIVTDFSRRLADSLGIPFCECLKKLGTAQQKRMENSYYQCNHARRSYELLDANEIPKRVLLVDDMVDSRWTMTVCGYLLMEAGSEEVYPFALADSSQREE